MKNYTEYLNEKNPKVLITLTDNKTMTLELFPSVAPLTVENFLKLVKNGFYTNITFHRVIPGFMIQGGDPDGTGMGGSKETIKGEFRSNGVANDLAHSRGVISMARTNAPNSASSQFFLMHDNAPHLDGSYAGFGIITEGLEVIDFIASTKTNSSDKPLIDRIIKEMVIINE